MYTVEIVLIIEFISINIQKKDPQSMVKLDDLTLWGLG